ncbi:MAG TPA: SRPBCC domain-containing protein [Polyangiaceae bacterium]|nr:SRPBCC domain-containing protein [Polyangiaceae bacterium]
MSLTDKTTTAQTESILFEFDLKHSPKKVWRALTEPALVAEWLLPAIELKLEPGASFIFRAPPQPGWDGTVNCQVLEIEPLTKLSWKWVVGDLNTVVTFTLTPTASGTRLVLVQSGFTPSQKRNLAGARYGWKSMGGKLVELLERTADE